MKVKRDYKKLVNRLIQIRKEIIVDIITGIYTLSTFRKDFGSFFSSDITTENLIQAITLIAETVLTKHPDGLDVIMEKIITRNKKYIEFMGYHKLSLNELIEEFKKDKTLSIHGEGITPEMMILYYYGENLFNHEYIPELIKQYEIYFQKSEETRMQYVKNISDTDSIPDVTQIERYFYESEDVQDIEDVDWQNVAKQFRCEYDEENKTFNKVKRGLILFYDTNIKVLKEMKASYESAFETLNAVSKRLVLSLEKQKEAWKHFNKLAEENRNLRTQIKSLRKQLSELETKFKSLNKATPQVKEKQLTELIKENYYLKTRIEKLEHQIEQLQLAQEINKEIVENVVIPESAVKEKVPVLPEYQTIAIVGGRWNSREKELLQQALPTCEIKFIDAEKTIAKMDTICNADFVIFDTSRNAHKYYYLIKENVKNLYLINKSTSNTVVEIFANNKE